MYSINYKKFTQELSRRIKERRKEMNLTYEDIAKETGLSTSTLLRYENGRIKNIPADKIELLAQALKISPSHLMGWDVDLERETLNENEELLLSSFRELNNQGKNKVIDYINDMLKINEYTMRIQIVTSCEECKVATQSESELGKEDVDK